MRESDNIKMKKNKETILDELVTLSHHLGDEANDYVIIGEGNTSARVDNETFLVKASGRNLKTIGPDGFVEIYLQRILALLEGDASDQDVTKVLSEAQVDQEASARPSVETILHGVLYQLTDAQFIGHTHASAVNAVLCSQHARDITLHTMPDEIVVCGVASIFVPYTDPGVSLARLVKKLVSEYLTQYGETPRVIYLQNHGPIALGQSARQVENITAMAAKHARILAGTYALGGPHALTTEDIARIHTRPDEEVRRAQFK
jgi:rhamnose utilization protein RhaD (predicted bifunctional aldolase and dehydrogenase)